LSRDLYLTPDIWRETTAALPGADLRISGDRAERPNRSGSKAGGCFLSQPAPRFHGAMPVMTEQVQKLVAGGTRVILAAPNTGEVERLADIFTEYNASYRLGSRTRSGESYADETAYFAGEIFTTTLLKAYIPDGFMLPDAHLAILRSARPVRRIRPGSLLGRSARNRKSPRFFPTSAICRSETTWSTSSMASASIRG
jgi:transcription-repair coupling factor (superfamily II helicase)